LSNNQLAGSLPDVFNTLVALTHMCVRLQRSLRLRSWHCLGFDSLPSHTSVALLLRLPRPRREFSNNSLAGSLPPSLTSMPQLRRMTLSNNKFTSELPLMAASTRLTFLELDHNAFSGSLPDLSFMDNTGYGITINVEARSGRSARSAPFCSALLLSCGLSRAAARRACAEQQFFREHCLTFPA
jgi:hypothetical protein